MPLLVGFLPELIIAGVALVIVYGLAMLIKAIFGALADNIPLIGGTLHRAIDSIIDDAVNLGYSAAVAVVHAVVPLFMAPVYWIEHHVKDVIDFFESLGSAIAYITGTLIPQTAKSLLGDINTAYHNAIAFAQSEAAALNTEIGRDVTAIYSTISRVETSLEHYAQSLFAAAEAYTAAAIAAETRFIDQVATGLEHEIAAGLAAETKFIQTVESTVISYIDHSIAAVDTALVKDITDVTTWVGQEVTALDHAIAAMGTQAIAFATAAVGVVEADLTRLETECTDNLCSGLSDLASLFNDLTGDLGLAALFALAAEFAADPKGAAADVQSTLGPVAEGASTVIRDLIGI